MDKTPETFEELSEALLADFVAVMRECIKHPDLIKQYNRLQGTHIGEDKRPPIIMMIDKQTGYQEVLDKRDMEEFKGFADFVFRCIYLPLLTQESK